MACERNLPTHISMAASEAMGDSVAIVHNLVHLPHLYFSLCSGKIGRGDTRALSYKPLGQQDIVRTWPALSIRLPHTEGKRRRQYLSNRRWRLCLLEIEVGRDR